SPTWLMILAGYKLPSQKSSINNCSARYFAIFCQALSKKSAKKSAKKNPNPPIFSVSIHIAHLDSCSRLIGPRSFSHFDK
ncbi:MAG: hypothetical protein H7839_23325, partial [Magnetococcus sp. YQC-5]